MSDLTTAQHWKNVFDAPAFDQEYHTDAPLGALWTAQGVRFSLWAPTATKVLLNLYRDGSEGAPYASAAMEKGDNGLWFHEEKGDLHGTYYDYEVTADGATCLTADPYAKACGLNGKRSMVVDLRKTDPAGWAEDKAPAYQAENVIYELHVKDFSWDPASGVPDNLRGKYKALTLNDTTLKGDGVQPTCLNHIKHLGVTHVQLLPIYDYGSVDEAGDKDAFNWGYDPVNYNVPEGSYATDPAHGEVRIRELKEAIQALHANGLRVIMDVVYNHTYQLRECCLFKAAPWYYYRQKADGSASNGSGCGTEIASERSMVSRYILDSLMYWAEEYHIDGFRFDLMGMLDVPLMNRIQRELDKRFGKGEKLLYGEPWAGGECRPRKGVELAHKGNMKALDPSIGAFCDDTRDAIKGSVMDEMSRGFVNGGGLDAHKLEHCLRAWAGDWGEFKTPFQTITYLSSHDDWTLWDKLVCTLDSKRNFTGCGEEIIRANKLAFAMLAGCQGHLFMLSGEEFGRTKEGVKNSYNVSVKINRMDWQRLKKNRDLAEYYRGLIALRKAQPGLRDKSAKAGERVLECRQLAKDVASVLLDNGRDSRYPELLMIFNASAGMYKAMLPQGKWAVLADGKSSFLWENPQMIIEMQEVPAMSALILGRIKG